METQKTETDKTVEKTDLKSKSKKIIYILCGALALMILIGGGLFVWQKLPTLNSPFNEKANPLKVSFALNEKSASKMINTDGGAVDLAGENAKYNINLPKDALAQGQNISLKELSKIDGLGSGVQLVAGVQAAPAGTIFLAPVDLTVETQAKGKLIGFAFEGNGENFHYYPVKFTNGKATMKISSFSGYGIINVGDGSYVPPTPESIDAKAQQLISKIILEGQNETGSLSENQLNRIYNLLNVWWKLKVKTELEKSTSNDELIIPAFDGYTVWLAGVQGLGLDSRFSAEHEYAMNTAATAVKNSYEKASKKCTEQKDATQIAKMSKMAKFAMKWGLNGRSGLNVDDILEKTKKCAVFELNIKSTMQIPDVEVTDSASGTVQIGIDDNFNLVGHGTVQQGAWTQKGFACDYVGGAPKYPVDVVSTQLSTVSKEQKVNIILRFDEPNNNLHCVSTIVEDFTSDLGNDNWLGDYFVINHDETYIPEGMFSISDWQIVNSGGVYAKKTVSRNKNVNLGSGVGYVMRENTTYELLHKPK